MKNCLPYIVIALALSIALPSFAADEVKPVRMGCGLMTFDTVPGWGLRPDGSSALGPTHGAVVIDKAGNIYTSANKGVVVFSPEGKLLGNLWTNERTSNCAFGDDGSTLYLTVDMYLCRVKTNTKGVAYGRPPYDK